MSDATMLPGQTGISRPGRRRSSNRGSNKAFLESFAFSAARGAALIAVAVIIGVAMLQLIDDGTKGPIGDGGSSAAATDTTTTTATNDTTTTTAKAAEAPARSPQEVRVLVLNGSGLQGAAGAMTNQLKTKGYQTETPADAATDREGNIVYFKPEYQRECQAVADSVGGSAQVVAIPDPPPTGSDTANCVVILGT